MLSRLKNYWGRFSGVERIALLVLFLLLAGGIAGYIWQRNRTTVPAPKNGGVYTEGFEGQPQHINPLLASANSVDADLARIVFASLYKLDPELNLQPDLAAELPQIGNNGKEYTIRLKNNLFWHDGHKLTADDVVYTFNTIQNPDYRSPLRLSWNRVAVQKIDDYQVRLVLREASAGFGANLTVGLLPKHIWETVPPENFAISKFNLEPVGSGPFRLAEMSRDRGGPIHSVTLLPFDKYYSGRPYLDSVSFLFYNSTDDLISAYQSRKIDGLGYLPYDQTLFLQKKNTIRQFLLPLPQYQAVFINRVKNPAPLDDVRVRTALAKSVDKERIIKEVYGGQSQEAYGPILPGHLGYHEQIPGADMNIYDVVKAKALLDQAGWTIDQTTGFRKDKLGRTITLALATNNFSPNVRVAQMLKEMWGSVGIQITLDIETTSDLDTNYIRPRNYELLLFSENVGADPDPFPFWHSSQLRDPGLNLSTFSNKQADKLLVDARGAIAPADRAAKYKQFQEIFVGDVPAVFLDRNVFVYNVSTAVKGLQLKTIVTPADRFADIRDWYIATKRIKK